MSFLQAPYCKPPPPPKKNLGVHCGLGIIINSIPFIYIHVPVCTVNHIRSPDAGTYDAKGAYVSFRFVLPAPSAVSGPDRGLGVEWN